MSIARLSHRRRSSLANLNVFTAIKAGRYGITSPTPRNVTFAPNVTPVTYVEPDPVLAVDPSSSSTSLLPPQPEVTQSTSRRRAPPGKRRSQGYIPRPPNAFMLFRADFVRQKHVPGSIETNHGSLSKIIGNCWHDLPEEEKRTWEEAAKKVKAEHQIKFPNYRFRPVHNKNKNKDKKGVASGGVTKSKSRTPVLISNDERRNEQLAHLLMEDKSAEYADGVAQFDYERSGPSNSSPQLVDNSLPYGMHMPKPLYAQRRSSSVPPPSMLFNPITIPSVPFLLPSHAGGSRAPSPVHNISRSQRTRRPSSVQPVPSRSWTFPEGFAGQAGMYMERTPMGMPESWQLQRDWSPLPEPDTSLFEPTFLGGGFSSSTSTASSGAEGGHEDFAFNPNFKHTRAHSDLGMSISPLESIAPDAFPSAFGNGPSSYPSPYSYPAPQDPLCIDGMGMGSDMDMGMQWSSSGPSSAFSPSPSPSDTSLPMLAMGPENIHAPQPQHSQAPVFDAWTAQDEQGLPLSDMQHHESMALQMCAQGSTMQMDASEPSFSDYAQSQSQDFAGFEGLDGMVKSYSYTDGIAGY